MNKNITEIISTIDFENIFLELGRIFSPLSKERLTMEFKSQAYEATFIFSPILNSANKVSSVAVAMQDEHLAAAPIAAAAVPDAPRPDEAKGEEIHKGLLDFFQKKFGKLVSKKNRN